MKVAVLFGQFEGYDEQPNAGVKRKRKKKKTDVEAITDALRELGHEAATFPIDTITGLTPRVSISESA